MSWIVGAAGAAEQPAVLSTVFRAAVSSNPPSRALSLPRCADAVGRTQAARSAKAKAAAGAPAGGPRPAAAPAVATGA